MNAAELDPRDFKLLGSFYTHDEFRIETDGGVVSIVPKQYSKRGLFLGLVVMALVSAPLFGFVGWAGLQRGTPPLQVIGILGPFWLLTVIGPIAFTHYRSKHLATMSPLVACELDSGTLAVRDGVQQYAGDEIVCLIALAMPNDEHRMHGEIQLVTRERGSFKFERSLVLTSYDGTIALYSGLGKLLSAYCSKTGIPGFTLRNGVFTRTPA